MTTNALFVQNLAKSFGAVVAVNSISFAVRKGSITALLGGNGAGKTTTLAMLMGLVEPTAGHIEMLGYNMPRDRYSILPRINFSSPYVDLPARLTIAENLTTFGHLYGIANVRSRINELAEDFNLKPLLKRHYGGLSAGQKTRVSLAKALLNKPDILLLDEPTASLDPDIADYVRTYLKNYQQTAGATLLWASHNMHEVETLCDETIIMKTGNIVDQGSPKNLIQSYGRNNLEEVFIDIARERRSTDVI